MLRASIPGIMLIAAGVAALVPVDGRLAWVFVLLAGIFMVVPLA